LAPDELSIIDRYFRPLAGEGAFNLRDDAARLDIPTGCELVVTADMIAESVHFLPADPPDTIAQKALRVNLSDLAGKGARPLAYVLSAGLGPAVDETWLAGFAAGLKRDQDRFAVTLLGGDTMSAPRETVISITAFGCAPKGKMVHRFGGQAGHALYVSGTIGAGAVGLALLKGEHGVWDRLAEQQRDVLKTRYRVPEPRVAMASVLADFASAAMDISDGLIGDCDKLAGASRCSALIEAERVPLPDGLAPVWDEDLLARLLTAGDDYEVLAAVSPGNEAGFMEAVTKAGVAVTRIGGLRGGSGPTQVLFRGKELSLKRRSYVHGRPEAS
jgi:thiamine-monophosphate kinase